MSNTKKPHLTAEEQRAFERGQLDARHEAHPLFTRIAGSILTTHPSPLSDDAKSGTWPVEWREAYLRGFGDGPGEPGHPVTCRRRCCR